MPTTPTKPSACSSPTDRVNACHQAIVRGFPRRHAENIREHGQPTDPAHRATHLRIFRAMRRGGCVLLTGDRGRGKTHLATLIGCEWLAWGLGWPRYWRAADLFADQRRWFDRKVNEWGSAIPEPLGQARECDLLVLDEVQERVGSDYEQAELVRLLDTRYAEIRPTVLITNRTPKEAITTIGPSAFDRLKEGGGIVECNWPNMRDALRGGAA